MIHMHPPKISHECSFHLLIFPSLDILIISVYYNCIHAWMTSPEGSISDFLFVLQGNLFKVALLSYEIMQHASGPGVESTNEKYLFWNSGSSKYALTLHGLL